MEGLETPTWRNLNDNSRHYYENMNDSDNSIDAGITSFFPDESSEWQSFGSINVPSYTSTPSNNKYTSAPKATSLSLPTPSPDRKYSVPVNLCSAQDGNHTNVKMRDKTNSVPSRPSSLIEAGGPELKELKVFEIGNLGDHGGRDRENRNINAIAHAMNEVSISQRHGIGTGVSHHFGPSLSVHGSAHNHGQGSVTAGDRVNLMPSNSTSTSRGSSQADLLECGASASTSDTPKSPLPGKC